MLLLALFCPYRLLEGPLQKLKWRVFHRDKILERLQAVYEEGDIVPIPFLKAADAVPTALLDDVRKPYMQPGSTAPAIVSIQLSDINPRKPSSPSAPQ